MTRFIKPLEDLVRKQVADNDQDVRVYIQDIRFQKLQLQTKNLLEREVRGLTKLHIVNCDLRTLQNMPIIPTLLELYVSQNKLQGTFENLMKLKSLTYLDASQNIIKDVTKLAPLRRIRGLACCFTGNPFEKSRATKAKLEEYGLKAEKDPRRQYVPKTNPSQKEQEQPSKGNSDSEIQAEILAIKPRIGLRLGAQSIFGRPSIQQDSRFALARQTNIVNIFALENMLRTRMTSNREQEDRELESQKQEESENELDRLEQSEQQEQEGGQASKDKDQSDSDQFGSI